MVAEVSQDDGVGGEHRTTYAYGGAKAALDGRGFLGFRWMESKDEQTGVFTTTDFHQSLDANGDYDASLFALTGQVVASASYLADGTNLSELANTWSVLTLDHDTGASGEETAFPYVASSTASTFELNDGPGNAAVTTVTTASTYDDYGNPLSITVDTVGGGETFTKVTTNTYANDTANWFLGRLACATVTSTVPAVPTGTLSATRTSGFEYSSATGLLTKEVIEPGAGDIAEPAGIADCVTTSSDAAITLVTSYAHDAYGNRTTVTVEGAGIASRTTTTDWGVRDAGGAVTLNGRFPVEVTNALGHTEERTYDARYGTVLKLTGPNLLETTWTYDAFARKLSESRADGTSTSWAYELCSAGCPAGAPAGSVYAVTETTTGAGPARVYFDLLNREMRTEATGFDGTAVYEDKSYDSLGRVISSTRAYYAGTANPPAATVTYDLIGRTLVATAPDGSTSTTAYAGLSTTVTNDLGQSNTRAVNAQGELKTSTDHLAGTNTYAYDPFGNLLTTTDDAGNVMTMSYDIRGRKLTMDDPDMGLWSYEYTELGELNKQTDAKGQVVTMSYDALGRMVARVEPEGTTTWTYDTATTGVGKLAQVDGPNGYQTVQRYDTLGAPERDRAHHHHGDLHDPHEL